MQITASLMEQSYMFASCNGATKVIIFLINVRKSHFKWQKYLKTLLKVFKKVYIIM